MMAMEALRSDVTTSLSTSLSAWAQRCSNSLGLSDSSWPRIAATVTAGLLASAVVFRAVAPKRRATIDKTNCIVVITGCDTGFGNMASKALAAQGYLVVSGCMTAEGVNDLSAIVTRAVLCDVTKADQVRELASSASDLAATSGACVWAVINNAGVGIFGLIDLLSMDAIRLMMDVNYIGLVEVTKAMLPLLKRTKGSRIVNISSVAGLGGATLFGPYAASKHAVEGFSKTLRQELIPWDIRVCNVNPAIMRTPMAAMAGDIARREFNRAPVEISSQYCLEEMMEKSADLMKTAEDPQKVVDMLIDVVGQHRPAMWNFPGVVSKLTRLLTWIPKDVEDWLMNIRNVPSPTAEGLQAARRALN